MAASAPQPADDQLSPSLPTPGGVNPAVRAIVDGLRPCHEPPATREAVWAVYDAVLAGGLAMLDTTEVREWLTGVATQALSDLPAVAGSGPAADVVVGAVLRALAT